MVAAEFSTAKCFFILILLPLASESNTLNKIKEKLIQKYSKESIYKRKIMGENSSWDCLDHNAATS